MDQLKLVWEDNADTPLNAANITKTIQTYKEGDLIFIDEGNLKLRANSKINMKIPYTTAFFDFNKTFSTHDTNNYFYPVSTTNVSFRKEGSSTLNEYSLGIESNTLNMIENSNFNGLDLWNSDVNGSTTITSIKSDESLFGNSAYLKIDAFGHQATLTQNKVLSSTDTLSLSFYYKTDDELKFELIGNPTITNRWWRSDSLITDWTYTSFTYTLSNTKGKWVRFELPSINISESDPLITEVQLKFYATGMSTNHYISDVQMEKKSYCTSYTSDSRGTPVFLLRKESFRIEQGLIDFQTKIQSFNSDYNYFFHIDTDENPAMRFYLDNSNKKFVFDVFNTKGTSQNLEENYIKCEHTFTTSDYNNLLNSWIRVILTWDFTKSTKELKMHLKTSTVSSEYEFISSATDFATYTNSKLTKVSIGGIFSGRSDKYISESLFKNLKCNIFSRADQKILKDFTYSTVPENNDYSAYEVSNKDIVIDTSLSPSTTYYIWLTRDSSDTDLSSIVLSTSEITPTTNYNYFAKCIGKFSTDSDSKALEYTIKDFTQEIRKTELDIVDSVPSNPGREGELRLVYSTKETALYVYISDKGWTKV